MTAKSFTVHNTANPNATAANHANYECNNNLTTSYHAVVDDKECVFLVPFNEQCWHAGDGSGPGNTTSLAMEVCEFTDTARTTAAIHNAERVIADCMTGKTPVGFRCTQLNGNNIVPHQKWSGKYCPRVILSSYGWDKFVAETKTLIGGAPVADSYAMVFAWAETAEARQRLIDKCVALNCARSYDGPVLYAHASTTKARELEQFIGADAQLHCMWSVATPQSTYNQIGVGDGIGTRPWIVVDPAQVSPDTGKLAAAKAKSEQIETLCNEIQAL